MKEHPIIFTGDSVKAILDGRKTQTRRVLKPQPDSGLNPFDGYAHIKVGNYHPTMIDKNGDEYPGDEIFGAYTDDGEWGWKCPYGQVGDRLWVRETWAVNPTMDNKPPRDISSVAFVYYKATAKGSPILRGKWRPSLFMPRWASRITLEITEVRVERVQGITAYDALLEGIGLPIPKGCEIPTPPAEYESWSGERRESWVKGQARATYFSRCADAQDHIDAFRNLWDSLNAKRGRIHRWEDDEGVIHRDRIYEDFGWEVNPYVWVINFKVNK